MATVASVTDATCAAYDSDNDVQIIELMRQGQDVTEENGLGASTKTTVHPRSRGDGMLEISNVPDQVADISDVAFSLHEVQQAAAVRMPLQGSTVRKDGPTVVALSAESP